MYRRFTDRARDVISTANEVASSRRQPVGPVHLLAAVACVDGYGKKALLDAGVDESTLIGKLPPPSTAPRRRGVDIAVPTRRLLEAAGRRAERLGDRYISTHHLLLMLADKELSPGTYSFLTSCGVDCAALKVRILSDLNKLRSA